MHKEALEDIRDLAVNYDGFNSIDGLKSLINDMQKIAIKALKGKKWYEAVASEPTVEGGRADVCAYKRGCKFKVGDPECGGCKYLTPAP